ncbi:MAG: hypothetical protein H6Q71_1378 [Firmicutes bacterium]|nr:hypothetical protein [Bacillota bacterium]
MLREAIYNYAPLLIAPILSPSHSGRTLMQSARYFVLQIHLWFAARKNENHSISNSLP